MAKAAKPSPYLQPARRANEYHRRNMWLALFISAMLAPQRFIPQQIQAQDQEESVCVSRWASRLLFL